MNNFVTKRFIEKVCDLIDYSYTSNQVLQEACWETAREWQHVQTPECQARAAGAYQDYLITGAIVAGHDEALSILEAAIEKQKSITWAIEKLNSAVAELPTGFSVAATADEAKASVAVCRGFGRREAYLSVIAAVRKLVEDGSQITQCNLTA